MSQDDVDAIWKALSDPTRRSILDLLRERSRTTGDIVEHFDVSRYAVMKHLTVLEQVGLLTAEKKGRERWNHLETGPLQQIYERWLSKQTAWAPSVDEEQIVEPELARASDEPLSEIYVVVRPEEKYAVERALQSVMPPIYTSMDAVGRGGEADPETKPRRFSWRKRQARTEFLPKTIFTILVSEHLVDDVLRSIGSALRLSGGPEDCGTGFAAVMAADEEYIIGAGSGKGAQRAKAEGWA